MGASKADDEDLERSRVKKCGQIRGKSNMKDLPHRVFSAWAVRASKPGKCMSTSMGRTKGARTGQLCKRDPLSVRSPLQARLMPSNCPPLLPEDIRTHNRVFSAAAAMTMPVIFPSFRPGLTNERGIDTPIISVKDPESWAAFCENSRPR
jgi:hypothetical protein